MLHPRLLLLSFLLIPVGCSYIPNMPALSSFADQHEDSEAVKAFAAHDYAHAADLYEQLVTANPAKVSYKIKEADSLRLSGNPSKARGLYDAAIAAAPNGSTQRIDAMEGKGLCYLQEADFNNATPIFTDVLKLDATRWRTINALGVSLSMQQHYKEAIDYYTMALQIRKNEPAVLNNAGLTYALSGDMKNAQVTLEYANHVSSSAELSKRIALNLALVYGIAGKMKEAEDVSKPYLTQSAIYNNLGYYAILSHNKKLAKGYLEKALAGSPSGYAKAQENMQMVK